MKVLVLFNSAYPIGAVSTHRVHNICKGLVENKVDLKLLIVHPTEQIQNVINQSTEGTYEGVNFKYISKKTYREKNIIKRKIIDFICHLKVLQWVLLNTSKSDITLVIGTSFDYRIILPIATLFTKTKIFLEINEYPFVNKKKTVLLRIKQWIIFRFILSLYNGFVVISDGLCDVVTKYKGKNASVIKIPILSSKTKLTDEIGVPPLKVPYIIHAGSLFEEKDGILGMLAAFGIACQSVESTLKFVCTGNLSGSSHAIEINQIISHYNLSGRVIFTGYLTKDQLINYYLHAALAIVNKYDTEQNRYCFATKLADYINYKVPIITTNIGEASRYFRDGYNAIVVEPGKTEILAEKIVFAISNPIIIQQYAANASLLIENDFDYKKQGKRLAHFFIESIGC